MSILYVFIGGGVGAVLRYLISVGWKAYCVGQEGAVTFPWPTLIANVLGCLMIGIFYAHSSSWGLSPNARLLLTTGLCGGFTTFSTFSYEALNLLRTGMYCSFALYATLSFILGLLAVALSFMHQNV